MRSHCACAYRPAGREVQVAGRGGEKTIGTGGEHLRLKREGVDDLCVSVLATWELCLPVSADRKRNFWKCIQGENRLLGSGWVYSGLRVGERERERGCVCI